MIVGPFNSGAAAGSAGSATNNADTKRITGMVWGIYVKYNDSPPAGTTDVTIKTKGTSPSIPSYNLLVLTNAATDGLFPIMSAVYDNAGSAISNQYLPFLVDDLLNIAIAGANSGDSVDVWLLLVD